MSPPARPRPLSSCTPDAAPCPSSLVTLVTHLVRARRDRRPSPTRPTRPGGIPSWTLPCEAAKLRGRPGPQRTRLSTARGQTVFIIPARPRNHAYRIPPRKRSREGSDPPTRVRPGGPAPAVDAIKQRQKQSHPPRPSPHLSSGSFDRPDSQDSCSSSSALSAPEPAPAPAPAPPSAPVLAMSQGPPPPPGNMFPYSQMAVHDMNGVGVCSCISFFPLRSVDG